jgi:hypothetical protein
MSKIRFSLVLCLLCPSFFINAQEVISLDKPVSINDNIHHFGHITLEKPYGKALNYTIRFNTLDKPKFNDTKSRHMVRFIKLINNNKSSADSPYANLIYILDSDADSENSSLEIKVFIPELFFSFDEQNFQLTYLHLTEDNKTITVTADVTIRFEQPEMLSYSHWKLIPERNLQIASVQKKEDHFVVHANERGRGALEVYKVRLLADERFVYQTPNRVLVSSFGLLNLPVKIRFGSLDYQGKHHVQWNNFAAHFGLAQHEKHTHFANGNYVNKLFGFGFFLHPSRQEVQYVRINNINNNTNLNSIMKLENPFEASFLGAGVSLYYAYNGFSIHFIPLAIDFQLNKRSFTHSAQDGVLYFGLGFGYTPKKWF